MFITSKSAVELGYVLKHIPGYEFSMDEFDDRLRFQKTVYLLQAFGINRGYDFSWYLRGPYCSLAAHDGYDLRDVYDSIPTGSRVFKSDGANKRFKKFCQFVEGKSTRDLEIAASLHYRKISEDWDEERIKKAVENKRGEFTWDMVNQVWDDMKRAGLV